MAYKIDYVGIREIFFLLLLGMPIGKDKRVSFGHDIHDKECAFSYFGLRIKHRTP